MSATIEPCLHFLNDVKAIILDICSNVDSETVRQFAVLLDVMWKNRNNIIWNNEREEADKLGMQAFYNWQDWFIAQEWKHNENANQSRTDWNPPDAGGSSAM